MTTATDPILAIAILVNILKPLLGLRLPPGSLLSDSAIRALALLLGLTGELAAAALTGTLTAATLPELAGRGFADGVLAIVVYHLVAAGGPEDSLGTPAAAPAQVR
jgi:hypothetical protein